MTPSHVDTAERAVPEALTGAHAGRVLSREIEFKFQVPRPFPGLKATPEAPIGRGVMGLARSTRDPEHAWKHHAREPGDPVTTHGDGPRDAVGSPRTQSIDEWEQGV